MADTPKGAPATIAIIHC